MPTSSLTGHLENVAVSQSPIYVHKLGFSPHMGVVFKMHCPFLQSIPFDHYFMRLSINNFFLEIIDMLPYTKPSIHVSGHRYGIGVMSSYLTISR